MDKTPGSPLKVVIIMPARNNARTLEATYKGIPADLIDEVVLVDNASRDDTVAVARRLGLTVVAHERDRGYGGSLKTCLQTALARGADLVLELHPDNQYDSSTIPEMLRVAREVRCGVVIGSRFGPSSRALAGGMPWWKFVCNRVLTAVNATLLGTRLSEFHSGYRVYTAEFLRTVPFEYDSDDYLFGFQILAQAVCYGFPVVEVPASSTYHAEATSANIGASLRYGLGTLWTSLQFVLSKVGVVHPAMFKVVGTSTRRAES